MPERNVRRYSQGHAECLQTWQNSRESHEGLQKTLPRIEVAECLSKLRVVVDIAKVRGNIKIFL